MKIEIADMAAFVAVVEAGSFTEAASRLSTTKSVISRRVSELEQQLGVVVLDRSARSVRTTEVGAVYYAKCVRILESIDAAHDFVAAFSRQVKGRLRVAVPRDYGAALFLPLLNRFAREYPDVVLDVEVDDQYVNLGDSHYDVAIRAGRLGDANYIARPLTDFHHWLCASPAYLEAHGEPRSLEELAAHDGLIDASSGTHGVWHLEVDGQPQACQPRERLRSNSVAHLAEAACDGLGIVLAPSVVAADAVADGRLRVVLPQLRSPIHQISLIYPTSRKTSPKVQALLAFLQEQVPTRSPWDARIEQQLGTP
ncbi:LysR family transcriptional regulator [Pseudoxanthomonas kalamensis]|uniref:LysR family transcriptional regulator n=1 Tax=Pseudoxanthomonas kalamensis TaxID=289483 RepID=UPI0013914FC4|nr:LysR family transcriptional regulator [Pseudoxanthomonas kalamensis]